VFFAISEGLTTVKAQVSQVSVQATHCAAVAISTFQAAVSEAFVKVAAQVIISSQLQASE
jgi:hypothetical protein